VVFILLEKYTLPTIMKHFYLFLLGLMAFTATAQLNIASPPDYIMCDPDGDEVAVFDLIAYSNDILGNLPPNDYTVAYYESYASAESNTSPIVNLTAYSNTTAVQTLFVRVTENANESNYVIVLASLRVVPTPIINQPSSITICDSDGTNDAMTTVDLTFNAEEIIAGCNSCMVTYYQTDDFNAPIENPESYIAFGSRTIYVKVSNVWTECEAFTTMAVSVLPAPEAVTLPVINSSNCTGGVYDLTLNNNLYNPQHEVSFYTTETDALAGTNAIGNPTFYVTNQQSVWVRVANVSSDANAPACFIVLQQQLSYNNNFLIVSVTITGQTAIINATGAVVINYSIVSGPPSGFYPTPYQTSNIFTNLELGTYTIQVQDICGNLRYITLNITDLDAPTGETSQTFTEGQTLADLEVSGGNIQWYDAPTGGTLLPITTLLVDNTTYYAERSLNRARVANRLAVTVHLVLSTGNNTLQNLTCYPNPVKNVLNIKNALPINSIAVYNTLGQQVLNSTINTNETNLDLSSLGNGIYFIKVQAGEGSKTLRIVKE